MDIQFARVNTAGAYVCLKTRLFLEPFAQLRLLSKILSVQSEIKLA